MYWKHEEFLFYYIQICETLWYDISLYHTIYASHFSSFKLHCEDGALIIAMRLFDTNYYRSTNTQDNRVGSLPRCNYVHFNL